MLQALGPEGGALAPVLRFLITFLLLLVPTTLMGATLPVLSKFVVRRLAGAGPGVGLLYGINTLGAVAGVVLVTFFLMEALGLKGSTWVVAAVNFTVAALALLVDRRLAATAADRFPGTGLETSGDPEIAPPSAPAADPSPDTGLEPARDPEVSPTSSPAAEPVPRYLVTAVIAAFGLSGFAALGYEVAWLRLFFVSFGVNTHYEFSIILIAFLLGISLGSLACGRYLQGRERPARPLRDDGGPHRPGGPLLRLPLRLVAGVERLDPAGPTPGGATAWASSPSPSSSCSCPPCSWAPSSRW